MTGPAEILIREKAILRSRIIAQRRSLAGDWVQNASQSLQDGVLSLEAWKHARRAALYIALRGEAGTDRLLGDCRAHGRAVALPARREQGTYGFAWWESDDGLESGPLRTQEPAVKRWVSPGDLDLVIVPGLAYDMAGRRLGHGGGHYDRLLGAGGDAAAALRIGIAFAFQLVEAVPVDERDVCVDWVVTEERVICCSRRAAAERGTR